MTEENKVAQEEETIPQEAGAAESEPENPAMPDEGELDADGGHLLEYKWTLWFDSHLKGQSSSTWGQTRRKVYTFSTVEDFWRLFNNIKQPSEYQPSTDYCLFKEGIEPEWEDARNENGGSWTVQAESRTSKDIDEFWQAVSMALVGEQFEEGEEVCGLMCSIRGRGNRIQLWTRNADREDAQLSIGQQLKQVLELKENGKLVYNAHQDAMKGRGHAKERYTV